MPLSCDCDTGGEADVDVVFEHLEDYAPLATVRGRRCHSCRSLIRVGDLCCRFERWREPRHDVERRIYDDYGQVPLALAYLCERCADLAFSLEELGFCPQPWEDQRELVRQYAEMQRRMRP